MSRIIKSNVEDASDVMEFSFSPISSSGIMSASATDSGSFVPLGIFNSSEYAGLNSPSGEENSQGPAEPPGIVISEEELNARTSEAFQNGMREGQSIAERGLINVFRSLRTAAEILQLQREKVLRETEDELLNLVMLIAKKVINREVAQDRTIVMSVIKAALEQLSERDEVVVRINTDDYVLLNTGHGDFFRRELESARVQLKADPSIIPGGCEVETILGTIEAGIGSQLDEIYRRLLEERNNTPE